jgi:RNA polymerase sigma-70 factor (ECF subfamily)
VNSTDSVEPAANDSIARWIDEARRGSSSALGQLAEACRAYLLLIANEELRPEVAGKVGASDLVQETFVRAQQGIPDFRGQSEAELRAWLRTILRNHVANVHRKYLQTEQTQVTREQPLAPSGEVTAQRPADHAPGPRTAVLTSERADLLRAALDRLPPDYRQVVVLRNWQRLSFAEVAERLGRSPEAVRKLWTRAIERLQTELATTYVC